MNKLAILKMIDKLINNKINNTLTSDTIEQICSKNEKIEFSTNILAYKETEFICHLFAILPYYKIKNFLDELIKDLKNYNLNNEKVKCNIKLIIAYLSDLMNNIKKRILTESYTHLYNLLKYYYLEENIDLKYFYHELKNYYPPEVITNMDIAQNIFYHQETLPGIDIKEDDNLSDKISEYNYQMISNIEKRLKTFIKKFFKQNDLKNFKNNLNDIINNTRKISPKEKALVERNLILLIEKLNKELYANSNKKKKHPSNQITLKFQ